MGCSSSRGRKDTNGPFYERPGGMTNSNNPLSDSEILSRIDASNESIALDISGVSIRYAWVSQRGYYPDAPNKENQDTFTVISNFGTKKTVDQCFFGVFDGHGKDGHLCARYVRDHLPRNIADALDQAAASNSQQNPNIIKKALSTAHTTTNVEMRYERSFDDTLSGTTAISILFRGRTMYISNVGDSRAIVISEFTGSNSSDGDIDGQQRLVASPMSSDQTPYRKDERERIKSTGARIMSMDQIEGIEPMHENWGDLNLGEDIDEGGDPPRVWSANGDYPGTAFTRSLGDKIAEDCGVTAEPEILERPILPNDKYIVIATDGVFEFLTNQMVADILARHSDPLVACKAVVQTAYNLWLQYEVRTDDITIIALYLDNIPRGSSFAISSSFYNPEEAAAVAALHNSLPFNTITGAASTTGVSTSGKTGFISNGGALSPVGAPSMSQYGFDGTSTGSKPVRRVMSREKRKHMIELHGQLTYGGDDDDDDAEEAEEVPKSEDEISILKSAIKTNFLFQHLNSAQRNAVVNVMKSVPVKAGDRIIKQGDRGDRFYVVGEGKFEVRVQQPSNNTPTPTSLGKSREDGDEFMSTGKSARVVRSTSNESNHSGLVLNSLNTKDENGRTLSSAELLVERLPDASPIEMEHDRESLGAVVHVYESGSNQHPGFGELSLMYGKPRAASVIAQTDGKLWSLDRRTFQKVVLRPKNMRQDVIKLLLSLDVFQYLSFTQIQRVTDLLTELKFVANEKIVWPDTDKQGDNFFLILKGECECKVRNSDGEITTIRLRENDSYGEAAFMEQMPVSCVESKMSSTAGDGSEGFVGKNDELIEAVAFSNLRILYLRKAAFEGVFGPLSVVAEKTRKRRNTMKMVENNVPREITEVTMKGVIGTDTTGPLLLGSFRSSKPNVTVWSFLLSAVEKKCLDDSLVRFIDATKTLLVDDMVPTSLLDSANGQCYSAMVPHFLSFTLQPNAVHIIFDTPIVADLSALIRSHHEETNMNNTLVSYVVACIVSALEKLHSLSIVYRAVQPESLYVDAAGHVVLTDFRICKIGMEDHGKTFTVCGASDYLAPEQITQIGHSFPVDFWGLGVLFYELSVGSHPFSSSSEVATYTRITSFGTKTFRALTFSDDTSTDARSLINQLLTPVPEARIGVGVNGFKALKSHPFLSKAFPDWEVISSGGQPSPLMDMVEAEMDSMLAEGVDDSVLKAFRKEYNGWEERQQKWDEIIQR